MHEITQLLLILVQFYATLGIMAIGFGMMVAGMDGASAAGNFLFVRPVQAMFQWLRMAFGGLVAAVSAPVIGTIKGWMPSEIKEVAKDIRWFVTRERGWLRRRG